MYTLGTLQHCIRENLNLNDEKSNENNKYICIWNASARFCFGAQTTIILSKTIIFSFFLKLLCRIKHILTTGRPFPIQNCSISNQTSYSFNIDCIEGFDGGLPQVFLLEVVEVPTLRLFRNITLMVRSFTFSLMLKQALNSIWKFNFRKNFFRVNTFWWGI